MPSVLLLLLLPDVSCPLVSPSSLAWTVSLVPMLSSDGLELPLTVTGGLSVLLLLLSAERKSSSVALLLSVADAWLSLRVLGWGELLVLPSPPLPPS